MAKLEELNPGAVVRGILPGNPVTIETVKWIGSDVIELVYKDQSGRVGNELVYRDKETMLKLIDPGQPFSLDTDGGLLRLVSEAKRIRLAYLFDPHLAVHTSMIDPLPHQITAVYGEMLTRQPLRYLLADDPGAGKTIMAGLLIKELMVRGDVARCLVVAPGNLVDQWQDELYQRFQLPFEILTNERIEAARTGNALAEMSLVIARLDKLARDEDLQAKLANTEWDLIICDEAHKMSASFFSGEIKETKRYKLGKLLSSVTRHFLLMTATPHNGKEADFQLFMALLDGDRFEGRFRDGVHVVDVSDLMRRMVKETLLKFDGTPLFPERRAYTVTYGLSDAEAALYKEVTDYVREEFNRADSLEKDGRRGTIGFALTVLQRRLASSPEAIYQSLKRRRERLEKRLRSEQIDKRGAEASAYLFAAGLTDEDWLELDELPEEEIEMMEDEVVDQASAARSIAELQAEIDTLRRLESLALRVRQSGTDKKWEELSRILDDRETMFDGEGNRRKLVIFTEHRDTLNYLSHKIRTLLGRDEAVATISGGMGREERRKIQESFTQDPSVQVLVATDAAGEGINLQRAHLMVNYDLPWNPNRIEQRFGRIHRIGQTEVCHLWNLVANMTREGEVYLTLLRKLDVEREALGGGVFDVLGKAIDGVELRRLIIEAIRYGEQPEVRNRLNRAVEQALDREKLKALIEEKALGQDSLTAGQVFRIKEDLERAEAKRLQPHFIEAFFLEALRLLGGNAKEREPQRYEITHVPAVIRQRDRLIGIGQPVLTRYERICFDKSLIHMEGKPPAAFICPGHPLLDAIIDLILERYSSLLKQGGVLIDENTEAQEPRYLYYLEHSIRDARPDSSGNPRIISRRLQFVEVAQDGQVRHAGYAPYLDYRPVREEEKETLVTVLAELQIDKSYEDRAISHAVQTLVPSHVREVKTRKTELITKTMAAVKERLTKEIMFWDNQANRLKEEEQAGKTNARLNSAKARQRADELQARLDKRMQELKEEGNISPLPPVVLGGILVLPALMIAQPSTVEIPPDLARNTKVTEVVAMEAVIQVERKLGYSPKDVGAEKVGYDVESIGSGGEMRFIEVKGRVAGARVVTVTKSEILTALNKPESYYLALVEVEGNRAREIRYVKQPFIQKPDFTVTSINYDWNKLWERGVAPHVTRNREGAV